MPADKAPSWMYPAGIVSLTLGGLCVFSHFVLGTGSGGTVDGAIIAALLDPFIIIGLPLGWYWLRRAKQAEPTAPVSQAVAEQPKWVPPPAAPRKPMPTIPRELELPAAKQGSSGVALTLTFCLGSVVGLIVGLAIGSSTSAPASNDVVGLDSMESTPNGARYWAIGDTKQQVQGIEGTPEVVTGDTARHAEVWHYNLSDRVIVDAKSGLITEWRNATGKLRVTIGARSMVPKPEANKTFWHNSTMQDVLVAQGLPQGAWWDPRSDTQSWHYQGSNAMSEAWVSFRSGLVSEWNDLKHVLHVQDPSTVVQAADNAPATETTKDVSTLVPNADTQSPDDRQSEALVQALRPGRLPQWSDYGDAAHGTITAVSRQGEILFCAAKFFRNMEGVAAERIPVFRRSKEPRNPPKFIGEMSGLAADSYAVAGRCDGFIPEVGDLVVAPLPSRGP